MEKVFLILISVTLSLALSDHSINKRVLPTNENCDPAAEVCRKGDWIDRSIADCEYERSFRHPISCDAQNDHPGSWTVDEADGDRCKPSSGKRFTCGAQGTNTRCVCSDTNILMLKFNECRCQYWPPEFIGVHSPAFCTGYYTGGTSGLHHWACCNNCNDAADQSCDGMTWQGGSPNSYCGQCGQNTGGGRVKYSFNCGSCDNQNSCASKCDAKNLDHAGLCWEWLDCFKSCCLDTATQPRNKRDVSEHSFCGDTLCSGSETPSTCPADCCYQINSDNCTRGTTCLPECCQISSCCLHEDDDNPTNNIDPSGNNNPSNNNNYGSSNNKAITIVVPMGVSILLLIVSIATNVL